jgi:DNA-binding transcriptional MerR regulator
MARFSISDIEKFTGIKAHTLRIWEQRYDMLTPKRTETNIRFYDDADLRYLLNVSILLNYGYRISQVAAMKQAQMEAAVVEVTRKDQKHYSNIKGLVAAMLVLDEDNFNKIITTSALQIGLEHTIMHVIFPFLEQVGILWMTGSIHPAHEHFISNLIKQKLYVAIDGQSQRLSGSSKKFLLYLPEGETHEIGLLFANYLLRSRGHQVVYLGQMTPEADILNVFESFSPDYIFTAVICATSCSDVDRFVESTAAIWKDAQVLIAGNCIHGCKLALPSNIQLIKKMEDLGLFLEKMNVSEAVTSA